MRWRGLGGCSWRFACRRRRGRRGRRRYRRRSGRGWRNSNDGPMRGRRWVWRLRARRWRRSRFLRLGLTARHQDQRSNCASERAEPERHPLEARLLSRRRARVHANRRSFHRGERLRQTAHAGEACSGFVDCAACDAFGAQFALDPAFHDRARRAPHIVMRIKRARDAFNLHHGLLQHHQFRPQMHSEQMRHIEKLQQQLRH